MIEVGFLYYCWQSRGGAGGGFDEADVLLTPIQRSVSVFGVDWVLCVVVLCSGGGRGLQLHPPNSGNEGQRKIHGCSVKPFNIEIYL